MPTVNYLWNPINDNIVREFDDDGNVIVDYTTEPNPHGAVISEHRDGETRFHLYDGQGNTVALTNDQGEVTDTFAYTAGGELTERTGTTPTPYQYKSEYGYYTDQTAGQIMVRVREYDPPLGRWMSVDREFIDGINSYRYARNNPVALFYPSDLVSELDNMDDLSDDSAAAPPKKYCVYRITKVTPTCKQPTCFGFMVGDIMCLKCPGGLLPKCKDPKVFPITDADTGEVLCTLEAKELNSRKCVACPKGGKDGLGGSPVN